jgi:glycosyltransferase involved in cell wall biosynthesis
MKPRSLAIVHNNIDDRSAIGKVAAWSVRAGLERGWQVTAVCRDLDGPLRGAVEHRPLYVPPRVHLLQWSVARPTVLVAMRGLRPDAMLVYQPQLAAIADVWHVQYLSRAARAVRRPPPASFTGRVHDVQAAAVTLLEDRHLRRLPETTRVLFCSDGLRRDYAGLFGDPPDAGVLYNPALLQAPDGDRRPPAAGLRAKLAGDHAGPVLGFLGGADPRKGGDLILEAMAREPELFLVHAGPSPLDDSAAVLRGRTRSLGHLRDVTGLLDAVDVLMVPSRFDPFGMVVAEAAARGTPVLVSEHVGAAPLVKETGAGAVWTPPEPLGPLVTGLIARREQVREGGKRLVQRLDPGRLAAQLFSDLDRAAERGRGRA